MSRPHSSSGEPTEPKAEGGPSPGSETVGASVDDPRHRGARRWRWLTPGILALATTAVVVALIAPGAPPATLPERRRAPGFLLPELQDLTQTVSLSPLAGRPLVLNFWASWCAPCRREAGTLEHAHQAFGNRVVFLGIDHQDGTVPAIDFLHEFHITYPSGYDPEGVVAPRFGLIGLPSTLFIDPHGQILERVTGPVDALRLRAAIEHLLAASRGTTRNTARTDVTRVPERLSGSRLPTRKVQSSLASLNARPAGHGTRDGERGAAGLGTRD